MCIPYLLQKMLLRRQIKQKVVYAQKMEKTTTMLTMEKVMANVTKRDHWAGAESARRTNWELFKRYDVLEYHQSGVEAKEADDQVTSNMQRDAAFLKHLGKVQGKSDAVPEAAGIK